MTGRKYARLELSLILTLTFFLTADRVRCNVEKEIDDWKIKCKVYNMMSLRK
jgi:hypothetical protein